MGCNQICLDAKRFFKTLNDWLALDVMTPTYATRERDRACCCSVCVAVARDACKMTVLLLGVRCTGSRIRGDRLQRGGDVRSKKKGKWQRRPTS
jgi:hypothetical protein